MDTIKLTLELTPAQLTLLLADLQNGSATPQTDDEELTEVFRNSYHPGEPRSASNAWLEEKLHEAEDIIRQRDQQLAAMEKLVKEAEERDKRLADQAQTIRTYRLRYHHTEQELDHLRNVCAEHEAACRQPIANVLAVYEDMANTGTLTDEEFTRRELGELRVQLTHLLKEAKRG